MRASTAKFCSRAGPRARRASIISTLKQGSVPEPGDGEVLMRTRWLSLDPYMRGRMSAAKSYAKPVEVGATMVGGTVGEVVASRNPNFAVGDIVMGYGGWQDYAVANGSGLRKLDPAAAPVSTALGVLGMPGMTAYAGLLEIGRPKAGETVAVAAASGAVGSVVGQIAKIKGCRAVGIAGGPDKCRFVVEELGFDACVDHRAGDFVRQLEAACPAGIDVYFENVGGAVQQAVWPLLNDFARVPVCGLISQYSATTPMPGPDMFSVLRKRLTLRGFIVWDFAAGRRISCAIWANGWAAAASSIARTWSRAWRTRLPRSLACSRARTSASCW